MTPQEAKAAIAKKQQEQGAEDLLGAKAAGTATPGPMRDIWAPVPDIKVGPHSIRRFRDGDFILLSQIGHPLNCFSAIYEEKGYGFIPSGEQAWQLCWLLTQPSKAARDKIASVGIPTVKAEAQETFEDLNAAQLTAMMQAITKQIAIYASAAVEIEAKEITQEGEKSSPPSKSSV